MATKTAPAPKAATVPAPRLKTFYDEKYRAELVKELGLSNVHQAPKLMKISVAVGIGKHKDDKRYHEIVTNTLRKITAQQPIDRIAKKSIAAFKIRAGMVGTSRIGVSVSLRGSKMYEFMDRLVNTVLPRVRDFHGVSAKAFDRQGNYSLGLTDQSVFPELSFEDTQVIHGLQVTFVINAQEPAHARALLEKFGLPFEKGDKR